MFGLMIILNYLMNYLKNQNVDLIIMTLNYNSKTPNYKINEISKKIKLY